jgi:hypothetical protein
MKAETQSELRGAVRFPVKLPISVKVEGEQHDAETFNISAGGVLFHLESDMQIGSNIEFQIAMPAAVLGAATDVMVMGSGRVIRCSAEEGDRRAVAAVIDEYRFERRQ